MRYVPMVLLLLAAGCASPNQPCLMPNANAADGGAAAVSSGGQKTESKPETGRIYGAPAPTSVYSRGPAEVKTDYKHEARQAGAIANPKAWTADTTSVASTSPSVLAAGACLEALAMKLAACPAGSPEETAVMNNIATLLEFSARTQKEHLQDIIKLAPTFERCVLVQIDLAGSSTGGQKPVDPANAKATGEGIPKALEKIGEILNAELVDEEPGTSEGEAPDKGPSGDGDDDE